ncbi:MAG TPA: TonB-dependent receptor, partial [Elusimicrobiota bacterium]|nr:TonB-dependent receptor [Elusimicrobiota bacterium]
NFNTKRNEAVFSTNAGAFTGIDKDIEEEITNSYVTWQRTFGRSRFYVRTFLTTDRDRSASSPLSRASTQGGSLEWQGELPLRAELFFGTDYEDSHIRSGSPSSRATQQYVAPFIQLSLPVWHERFIFLAGVRYDNNSKFTDQWTPKYGVVWKILPDLRARANLNYGFRAPTVTELYSTNTRAFGNAHLRPDKNRQHEIGLSYSKKAGGIDLSAYKNVETDMIVSQVPVAPLTYQGAAVQKQYRNVDGKSAYRGVEVRARYAFLSHFEAGAGYSYLDPGTLTFHTDKNTAQSSLTYRDGRFSTTVDMTHAGGRYTLDNFTGKRAAYTVYHWSGGWTFARHFTYYLRFNNITDQEYALNFYDPMPGRTYLTGLEMTF